MRQKYTTPHLGARSCPYTILLSLGSDSELSLPIWLTPSPRVWPQTNGHRRFHKTMLYEFYRIVFCKEVYATIDGLQADLGLWMREFNDIRLHEGKWCFGKTPIQKPSLTRCRCRAKKRSRRATQPEVRTASSRRLSDQSRMSRIYDHGSKDFWATLPFALGRMRLCHSRMMFIRAYPRETQEMVFDAH